MKIRELPDPGKKSQRLRVELAAAISRVQSAGGGEAVDLSNMLNSALSILNGEAILSVNFASIPQSDQIVQNGSTFRIQVSIQNSGHGPAENLFVSQPVIPGAILSSTASTAMDSSGAYQPGSHSEGFGVTFDELANGYANITYTYTINDVNSLPESVDIDFSVGGSEFDSQTVNLAFDVVEVYLASSWDVDPVNPEGETVLTLDVDHSGSEGRYIYVHPVRDEDGQLEGWTATLDESGDFEDAGFTNGFNQVIYKCFVDANETKSLKLTYTAAAAGTYQTHQLFRISIHGEDNPPYTVTKRFVDNSTIDLASVE